MDRVSSSLLAAASVFMTRGSGSAMPSLQSLQVVRYLQDNGSMVQEGEPYVELEASRECTAQI